MQSRHFSRYWPLFFILLIAALARGYFYLLLGSTHSIIPDAACRSLMAFDFFRGLTDSSLRLDLVPGSFVWLPLPMYFTSVFLFLGLSLKTAAMLSSFVPSLMSIYGGFLLAGKLMSRHWALFAAGIIAISPQHVFLGVVALDESYFFCALIFSLYFIVCFSDQQKTKLIYLSSLAVGLGCLCRYEMWGFALLLPLVTLFEKQKITQLIA